MTGRKITVGNSGNGETEKDMGKGRRKGRKGRQGKELLKNSA